MATQSRKTATADELRPGRRRSRSIGSRISRFGRPWLAERSHCEIQIPLDACGPEMVDRVRGNALSSLKRFPMHFPTTERILHEPSTVFVLVCF